MIYWRNLRGIMADNASFHRQEDRFREYSILGFLAVLHGIRRRR